MCRDAMAYGNRLLRDWRVQYEGFVEPERWQELKRGGADGELKEEGQEETVPETIGAVTETLEKMSEAEGEEPKEQPLHGKSISSNCNPYLGNILLIHFTVNPHRSRSPDLIGSGT